MHISDPTETTYTARQILDVLDSKQLASCVEMTGGNVATIYAGRQVSAIAIGPGSYDYQQPELSTFYAEELFVGPNDDSGHGYYVKSLDELSIAVDAVEGDARAIDYLSKECVACAGSGIVPRRGGAVAVECPTCEGRGVVRW